MQRQLMDKRAVALAGYLWLLAATSLQYLCAHPLFPKQVTYGLSYSWGATFWYVVAKYLYYHLNSCLTMRRHTPGSM